MQGAMPKSRSLLPYKPMANALDFCGRKGYGIVMKINTSKLGVTDIDEDKIILFPYGILGFESIKLFTIIKTDESIPVYWLQAIEEDISLPCINPYDFFQQYAPLITDEDMEKIKAKKYTELLVLNTIVVHEKPLGATSNLAAPIVINTTKKQGAQIVLQNSDFKVREPLAQ